MRIARRLTPYVGIGVLVRSSKKGLRVLCVFPESAADRAGIRIGDVIHNADSSHAVGAIRALRGASGSAINISVVSEGGLRRVEQLVRGPVPIPLPETPIDYSGEPGTVDLNDDGSCPVSVVMSCPCPVGCDQDYCESVGSLLKTAGGNCFYKFGGCTCGAYA